MSSSFNLQFSVAPFPTGFDGNLDAYATQLVANLSATITGNFLTGQIGGTAPTTNIGPWANGTQWWFWNASLPTPAYQSEFSLLQPEYNSIINGDHQVFQRQVSATLVGATQGYFGTDRWKYTGSMATGQATISAIGTGITGGQFVNTVNPAVEYAYRISVTTAQPVLAAGDHFEISHIVEQQIARPLFNVPTSLGIGLRSSIAGTFCVSISDSIGGESWIGDCVLSAANIWQFFPFPTILPFPAGSSLGASDTAAAYIVRICAAAGATYRAGTNGAWSAANNLSDSNQSNLFINSPNTLDFTLAKHQPGSICTPFQSVGFDQSLARCQRYYAKSYDYGIFAGAVSAVGGAVFTGINTTLASGTVIYPVPMRAIGTPTIFNPVAGTGNQTYDLTAGGNAGASVVPGQINSKGFTALVAASGLVAGHQHYFHWVEDVDF